MKLTVQSLHFDASQQLKDFADQKVGKLDRFFDGIISAEVVLSLDKAENTENKVSKITLAVPNDTLVAEKQCKSFEEGIDLACEALRKQLLKYKEK
ncbi:MAG: ribosome-associated translation inhibitor RaiA [Bacteroidales bacterium]|nr:ribosome-associated translation inhibitor RaiA [Bacteroidales bacterium]MDY4173925.1 ribosome-associated translation inhibitor RaiA [Bacteroidales bacterium]